MHPYIWTVMGTYYGRFQIVNVPGICEEAGASFPNVMDKFVHPDHPKDGNGRNPVCFNHLCRRCTYKKCTFSHLSAKEVGGTYAEEVVAMLGVGATKALAAPAGKSKKYKNNRKSG